MPTTTSSYRPRGRRPHSNARQSVRAHVRTARATAAYPPGAPVRPPSFGSQAEMFLDELAEHDDRLFRGDEPHIEGAAETMLVDWTRRRIRLFVSPPNERPADMNAKAVGEQKRKAFADVTGKPVVTVKQAWTPNKERDT
jgi:hypothetical protein